MSEHPEPEFPPPDDDARVVRPNFITEVIDADLEAGRHRTVVTRFPPEPNGYLHIGHAMAIMLNLGLADDYRGHANLRFDDTNPITEDPKFVTAMKADIAWLGFEWDNLHHASDYFETLYGLALRFIEQGDAYVDSLSEEEIRDYRGTVTEPGQPSPYRNRTVAENLALFEGMRKGDFGEGEHVLRARIDMAARNMIMRDPLLYRIRHTPHYRTGSEWHIYPMYNFAHPLSDAIEGVTHSLCTLEFENNREFYDWLVERLFDEPRPHQYEFARLDLEYLITSKRKLMQLVEGGYVSGWDDPRMPTLAGLRRRGVTPEALRDLVDRTGVTKTNARNDYALLEYAIRDDLNSRAPRVMAVIDPLKVTITNLPNGSAEMLDAPYWPHDVPKDGSRPLPFSGSLWIERADFSEVPPEGWRRLSPGDSVRLRHAYVITCDEVITGDDDRVVELRCRYHPDSRGELPAGLAVSGVIHWLSAPQAVPAEFRLYERLFSEPVPGAGGKPFLEDLNLESLLQKRGFVEPSVVNDPSDTRYQFERQGYFWRDTRDSTREGPVFNRIVTLRDSWGKAARTSKAGPTKNVARVDQAQPQTEKKPDLVADLTAAQRPLFERYRGLGVARDEAALIAGDSELTTFFDEVLSAHDDPVAVANWVVNDLRRELKGRALSDLPFDVHAFARLIALADDGTISTRAAKEVFEAMVAGEGDPDGIVAARGLKQVSDAGALEPLIAKVLGDNPDKVAAFRGGKTGLLGFFVGQAMRETRGAANPQLVRELLERALG